MNVIRIRDSDALQPLHIVMIFLVTMTVAGGCLLLSAAESTTLVDGAVEWQAESPLRAVVQLLCLDYRVPTIHAGEIKGYVLGIGAGLATLALTLGITTGRRNGEDEAVALEDEDSAGLGPALRRVQVSPLAAAQLLLGLYLLWSFASSRWSSAPTLAVGGSVLLTIHFLWAFSISRGLSPAAARIAVRIMLGVTALTGAVAAWYYYGRNPVLRAKFPFGNPNFLAVCLIPGITLAATFLGTRIVESVATRQWRPFVAAGLVIPVAALGVWAFLLADSRGSAAGLGMGLLAVLFFTLPGRLRLAPVVLALGLAIAGVMYVSSAATNASPTGRDETLRFRAYAWNYALRLFEEKPFTGHGQGGFVLKGDSLCVHDVPADPLVFGSRIDHAHNEWLEVLADLGSVGWVLLAAAMFLTLRTGMRALRTFSASNERWPLLGSMGALVGLLVSESFGVGLRVEDVPPMFYTVVGLVWALSASPKGGWNAFLSRTPRRRTMTALVGGLVAIATLVITQQDFTVARNAYRCGEQLHKGDLDAAIRLASAATGPLTPLNPARALVNLFRLAETHVWQAEKRQERGLDRGRRATESQPPNPQLRLLAEQDLDTADDHCKIASHKLKELVSRSPGFMDAGRLEYRINLIQARIASVRGDEPASQALLKNAAAAVERELLRQPFDVGTTVDYLRASGATLDGRQVLDVLARPLRHNRIADSYVEVLRHLASDPDFERRLEPLLHEARNAVRGSPPTDQAGSPLEIWAPEKLRLAAAIRFLRGDYETAASELEWAAQGYESPAASAPLGAASCYAEWADCQFFGRPDEPSTALASAEQALGLAPESRLGREFRQSVKQRMIHYHLAADDEAQAERLLRESAPAGVSDEIVRHELGVRIRRLCESLLLQRREALVLLRPASDLLPKLQRWLRRAVELNPEDFLTHYLAADLAFHVGDDEGTAAHLRRALDLGLPLADAEQFLSVARRQKPDSPALESLWRAISSATSSDAPGG